MDCEYCFMLALKTSNFLKTFFWITFTVCFPICHKSAWIAREIIHLSEQRNRYLSSTIDYPLAVLLTQFCWLSCDVSEQASTQQMTKHGQRGRKQINACRDIWALVDCRCLLWSVPCHIVSLSTCSLAGCHSEGANESSGEWCEELRPSARPPLLLGALWGLVSLPRLTTQIDF